MSAPRSAQSLLIGPSIYLRPVVYSDGGEAAIWQSSLFPVPAQVVESELRKQLEVPFAVQNANQCFLACRRSDHRILGSATLAVVPCRSGTITLHVDSLLSEQTRQLVAEELAGILVKWILGECNLKWASMIVDELADAPRPEFCAPGGRFAWRLRNSLQRDGKGFGRLCWQWLNPVWFELLGPPREPRKSDSETTLPIQPTISKPARFRLGQRPHPTAIAAGEQIYLRAFEPDESFAVAETWFQETEHFLPGGRIVGNPHTYGYVHRSIAETDLPTWIRLAVCLVTTDELIGVCGLRGIDWIARTAESQTGIFRTRHRNRGLSSEIKFLLLDYAFNRLGLEMIWAQVEEGNDRSVAALRKQGYREAGYLAWTRLDARGMCGDWYFDLLAPEWRARSAGS